MSQPKQSFRAMARAMGCTASQLADAEPWTPELAAEYAAKHGNRAEAIDDQRLPDAQVAAGVRMLMREDLDHEAVVQMARDRICALVEEKRRASDIERCARAMFSAFGGEPPDWLRPEYDALAAIFEGAS